MADAVAKKEIGGGFIGAPSQHVVLEYDFANDGGTAQAYDLGIFKQKCVIKGAYAHVVTACTSGGSATVKIGTTDDDDGILDTTSGAVANLIADAVLFETNGASGLFVDANDEIILTVGTAALTAGKIHVHLDVDLLDS